MTPFLARLVALALAYACLCDLRPSWASKSEEPGTLQCVTVRNGSCCPVSAVNAWGYRDGTRRLAGALPTLPAGRSMPIPMSGYVRVIDRLVVELCVDPAQNRGLRARYPDNMSATGDRRIISARVTIDRSGWGGDLTVYFFGGGWATAPLFRVRAVCPARPEKLDQEQARVRETRETELVASDHEDMPFETLDVVNDHPQHPVNSAQAYQFVKPSTPPVGAPFQYLGNVVTPTPIQPNNGMISEPSSLNANEVAVEVLVGGTYFVAVSTRQDRQFVRAAVATVREVAGATTVGVKFRYDQQTDFEPELAATAQSTPYRWTGLKLTSQRNEIVTVSACPAQCAAGDANLALRARAPAVPEGSMKTIDNVAHLAPAYATLYVCVVVGATSTEKRLTVEGGDYIKKVSVAVATNGTVTVAGSTWSGGTAVVDDPPACPQAE